MCDLELIGMVLCKFIQFVSQQDIIFGLVRVNDFDVGLVLCLA